MRRLALLLLVSLGLAACGGNSQEEEVVLSAVDPDVETCAMCGMVVREQPVPRAQIIHRDGSRMHLCAVSELSTYLAAPSPHGKVEAVFVETLRPEDGPETTVTDPRPWAPAQEVTFVVGCPDRPVMGESILAFARAEDARTLAEGCEGRTLTWNELLPHLGGASPR